MERCQDQVLTDQSMYVAQDTENPNYVLVALHKRDIPNVLSRHGNRYTVRKYKYRLTNVSVMLLISDILDDLIENR